MYWSVDAACAVHNDMQGHMGAHIFLFVQGTVVEISTKQEVITQSSTEAELLVGVDDPFPLILWSRLFALAQGTNIDDNILYQQNNLSTICIENNGKASCTKRTKNIESRYFYIIDKVKSSEVTILSIVLAKKLWLISLQNLLLERCSRNSEISSNVLTRVTCSSTREYMIRLLPIDWPVS